MKKRMTWIVIIVMMLSMLAGCESSDYKKAVAAYDAGNYQEAAMLFEALGSYEDSADKAIDSKYMYAETLIRAEDYEQAINIYKQLDSYKDSAEKIANAEKMLMYKTYADVFDVLSKEVLFFEASSDNAVNVVTFTQENANIKQISYTGNGPQMSGENACEYIIDDQAITITLADQSTMQVAYTLNNGTISYGDGFFTPEQVEDGLNGYWGLKKTDYNKFTGFSTSEYIYFFNDGNVKFESATTAYGYNDGSYYYYGPYEGTYTVNENGLEVDAHNEWQFGFVISEGKVAAYRCTEILSPYDGFKGEDGFSF